VTPALEVTSPPDEDVCCHPSPAEHLVSELAAPPIPFGIVRNNDQDVEVSFRALGAARAGAKEVDALRLINALQPRDDFV
jgi:hypothetical protein